MKKQRAQKPSEKESLKWAVMCVQPWSSIKTMDGRHIVAHDKRAPTGYIPVFDKRSDAEFWAKDRWNVMPLEVIG